MLPFLCNYRDELCFKMFVHFYFLFLFQVSNAISGRPNNNTETELLITPPIRPCDEYGNVLATHCRPYTVSVLLTGITVFARWRLKYLKTRLYRNSPLLLLLFCEKTLKRRIRVQVTEFTRSIFFFVQAFPRGQAGGWLG